MADLFYISQSYCDSDGTILGTEFLVFEPTIDDDGKSIPGQLLCILPDGDDSLSNAITWFEDAGVRLVLFDDDLAFTDE